MRRGVRVFRPPAWAIDPAIVTIWAIGLLVRLVLLPTTFHSDLYQVYSRAAWAVAHGAWFAWSSQLIAQLLHDLWLLLVWPLLPASRDIWSPTAGIAGIGAQPGDIERFLAYPYVGRALVLLKLPYVASDALVGWLVSRQVEPARRPRALALWWLNPIVIYTSAAFGRHDSVWIALVMLGAHLARRGRRGIGLACTVLAAAARFFPALLLPFYLVAYRRSWRSVAFVTLGIALAWGAVDALVLARTGTSPTLTLLGDYPHVRYLVALALPVGEEGQLPVFPLAWALFFLWWVMRFEGGEGAYTIGAAVSLAFVVALTPFHPQYVLWALPFVVPTLAQRPFGTLLAASQVLLFVVWLSRWGASVTTELLLPLGRDIVQQLPDPQLVASALIPAAVWQPVVRALFAAVTLATAWLTVEAERRRRSESVAATVELSRSER